MSIVQCWVSFSTCSFSAGVMGWETELDWVRGLRCDKRNIVAVMK